LHETRTGDSLYHALAELGLSIYEAKAYVALLKQHPAKAQEVSKNSGVPAARVYETLSRLADKGLAVPVNSDPIMYEPLPTEEFIKLHRGRYERTLDSIAKQLEEVTVRPSVEVLWHIRGYDNLMQKARELIERADRQVLVSMWTPQIEDLAGNLFAAKTRGVSIISMQMGDDPAGNGFWPVGQVYRHVKLSNMYVRHGSELLLSVDDSYGLLMSQESGRDWEGFWTSNKAIVRVIANYIRHDIYVNKILNKAFDVISDLYGQDLELLICLDKDKVNNSPEKV
jgi:predicted transcriptional regulator